MNEIVRVVQRCILATTISHTHTRTHTNRYIADETMRESTTEGRLPRGWRKNQHLTV